MVFAVRWYQGSTPIASPASALKRHLQEVLNTLGQFTGLDNFEWLHVDGLAAARAQGRKGGQPKANVKTIE